MAKRRIVITGVSKGLGRALAEGFIAQGHVVWGCARSGRQIDDLSRRFASPHDFQVVDVCDDNAVGAWCRRIVAEGGAPDLLVNNAAIINPCAPLWEVPTEDFSRVIEVNITGVFHVLRHLVPTMIERGSGVIVNLSSGWGRSTSPEVAPYCATKWAIEGMTKALADELPRGMAAIPLNPGVIHTEMLETCFGAEAASYPGPKQWARRAVPFVLSLGPRHNGESLTVL